MTTTGGDDHKSQLSASSLKSYAEAAKIIDELLRRYGHDLIDFFDAKSREKAKIIKSEIGELRFDSAEFREILNRISSGKFESKQIEKLGGLLQSTAAEVAGILFNLSEEHHKFIDERYGAGFWNRIDTEVREMKGSIRKRIFDLSKSKATPNAKQKLADNILKDIEQFNRDLASICDIIVRPKRATQ